MSLCRHVDFACGLLAVRPNRLEPFLGVSALSDAWALLGVAAQIEREGAEAEGAAHF